MDMNILTISNSGIISHGMDDSLESNSTEEIKEENRVDN